jgi:hypothetical protein
MKKNWKLLLMAPALLTLTSCETPEDQQLAAAQQCIDGARTSSDADLCYAAVDGLESEKAYLVRCSAAYIAQGFTGARFASAFQRLKDNPSSGQDPMATVMAYLIFSKPSSVYTAEKTLENCTKSGVRAMVRLATMTKLATFIAQSGVGGITANLDPTSATFDPAAISTAITNLANSGSPADQATVGNIAIQANTAYCNEGSSFENNEICKNLQQAIATGNDATAIGQALLAQLQQVN